MFAPLRIISGYSFLQSGLTIERIVDSIKKLGYSSAGISDHHVLYGVPSFIKEMKKAKKNPLIGMEINLLDCNLVSYVLNEEGYLNLLYLSSLASEDKLTIGEYKIHSKGLATILETNYGKFKELFIEDRINEFTKPLAEISSYSDKFYLGLEVNSREEFNYAQKVREFAKEHLYETIAFPQIRYQKKEDAIILSIANAIDKDEKLDVKEQNGPHYFNTIEYYQKLYTKKEIDLTEELVNSSTFVFEKKRGEIVKFSPNPNEELKNKVFEGLKRLNLSDDAHVNRANYELDVISSMGYSDYFLIVSDFVNYAKSHDIIVGAGRGSAAGSLVSHALNITEVDPLKYDLLFERFLNKSRKSMPDIDIDFMDTKRDEVIDYVIKKYGEDRVGNIVTFQTIQAKQALRDIGRIYDIPTRHIDLLSKSITEKISLRSAYKSIPSFKSLVDSDKYFLEIVSLASKIEGLPRQSGLHAAGVILNNAPLREVIPTTVDLDGRLVSQYEKDYLEEQGFLKIDFLALRNLTTVDFCLKLLKQNRNINLKVDEIPYEDENIFKLLCTTQTIGIFQLESSGMRNAIKTLKPKVFEDVVALLALFRPGPQDNIKDYANRKEGKIKVSYVNGDLKKILSSTYGVLIYQEQVMQIATVMGGFTPEKADLFRSAVSKKHVEQIESNRVDFIKGAISKGYSKEYSEKMFNDILKFGNYGFNKSHAVVYAILACRMAYLKYYYPLEFYTSILSITSGENDTKFSEYVSEIKSRNLKVYPPDINKSKDTFIACDDGLIFPLTNIKGLNRDASDKILADREINGEYKDYFEFVSRMYALKISDKVIEKLINSGALDRFNSSRATLRNTIRYAYQLAELSYDKNGQLILDITLDSQKQFFTDIDNPIDNLNLEYDALGIMLSDNPLKYKREELAKQGISSIEEAIKSNRKTKIAGIIASVKTIKVRKNGSTMAFIKVFDETGEVEVTVFSRVYQESFQILNKNQIVIISGRYESSNDREGYTADNITLMEEVTNE